VNGLLKEANTQGFQVLFALPELVIKHLMSELSFLLELAGNLAVRSEL